MKILFRYIKKYSIVKQLIKFGIVGVTSAIISFIALYSFTQWLGLWYLYSSIFGYIISAIFNFITNKFWTFGNKENGVEIFSQSVKFFVVILVGLIVNTLIIYLLTELRDLDYRLSWLVATGLIAFWSFGMNRFWTFKSKSINLSAGDL